MIVHAPRLSPFIAVSGLAAAVLLAGCATTQETAVAPDADSPLSALYGAWSGPASGVGPGGASFALTQHERVGPMLDGRLTVIEGRGYDDAGALVFNAFAVISHDARTNAWEIRSYKDDAAGTFPLTITEDGFVWSTPAGPGAAMRFTVTVDGETWHEIGEYVPAEGDPHQTFEMTLTRDGDADWPAAEAP